MARRRELGREVVKEGREDLFCVLTPEEIAAKGRELADAQVRIQDADEALAEARETYKTKVKPLELIRSELARSIKHGQEVREVEVEVVADWAACTVDVIRKDTGEPVRSRKMRPEERQRSLLSIGDLDDESQQSELEKAADAKT